MTGPHRYQQADPPLPTPEMLPPLRPTTRACYQADWAAFTLWCEALHQNPLPASAATIVAYLAANPARPATQSRRLAALNRTHREHHHQPPGAQQPVQEALAALRPTPAPTSPGPDPVLIDQALTRIPTGGWPTGMFGRRDALLLTLRYRARLSLTQLVTLTSDDLHLDPDRRLRIQTSGHTVVLVPAEDPRTCPTCIWRRWRTILTLAARRASNRALADRLNKAPPSPTDHPCLTPATRPGPAIVLPVFMPIDRWGSLPGIYRPTTTRTAIALTTSHLSDQPPVHPARIQAPHAADLPTQPAAAAPPPPAAHPLDYAPTYAAGLAARRHAVLQLRDVHLELNDVDRATAELDRRIIELSQLFQT